MKLQSSAKINLTLDIVGRRDDGYHELETVYQEVRLRDDLSVEPRTDGAVSVTCSRSHLAGEANLCHRAALLMRERFGIGDGVAIHVEKRIPEGAGLGGGSGNAAAVIKAMVRLFGVVASQDELMALGAELGMDVPFHLAGGTCLGRGRGAIIEVLTPLPLHHVVIVFPGFSVNTREAYGSLDYGKTGRAGSSRRFKEEGAAAPLHNDFEWSVMARHPELAALKEALGPRSLLSGSGSCVFGLYAERAEATRRLLLVGSRYPTTYMAETARGSEENPCSGEGPWRS